MSDMEAIGELLAERDRLRAQVENLRSAIHTCGPTCSKAACVNRRLRADVAELLKGLSDVLSVTRHLGVCQATMEEASALLAKHRPDPLQAVVGNASDLGHNARLSRCGQPRNGYACGQGENQCAIARSK